MVPILDIVCLESEPAPILISSLNCYTDSIRMSLNLSKTYLSSY